MPAIPQMITLLEVGVSDVREVIAITLMKLLKQGNYGNMPSFLT